MISGTQSAHESFDLVSGTGKQLVTVPVGAANTISVTFDQNVAVTQNALMLSSNEGIQYGSGTSFSGFNETTRTASWTFNTFLLPDQIVLSIDPDMVTGGAGAKLDGEWQNALNTSDGTTTDDCGVVKAISTFPSGNGVAGGDFGFYFTILPGDGSRNNLIGQGDLDKVLANWGKGNATWWHGDTSGNGLVEQADMDHVLGNWGDGSGEWAVQWGGMMSSGLSAQTSERNQPLGDRRADFLAALDQSFSNLGMDEVWDSLNVNESKVLASDASFEAFMDKMARAPDAYYGVQTP